MTGIGATPQRLYLLQLLSTSIPTPRGPMAFSAGSYLIETGDGRHILIDTGFPEDMPVSSGASPASERKGVIVYLADLGLQPDDIDTLICTHFDVDHCGQHDAFTNAELIVQREHYELARGGHERFAKARGHWDHPALRYRQVDGDTELLPGLTLIETSGHTPSHQSVLVQLPETGPVLLAIDAVPMRHLFTPERQASPIDDNEEQLRASTRKLLDLVEHEQVGLVVFGHDGRQWQTLRKAPEWYA